MSLENPFQELAFGELFGTLLPDFVLAFTFFTALTYAVLGKRFDHQRSAAAMAAASGWPWRPAWSGGSKAKAGPFVTWAPWPLRLPWWCWASRCTRRSGKPAARLAGTMIALGICVLMTVIFEMDTHIQAEAVEAVIVVAPVVARLHFDSHLSKAHPMALPIAAGAERIRPDQAGHRRPTAQPAGELGHQPSHSANAAGGRGRPHSTGIRPGRPGAASAVLPAEGWLTERWPDFEPRPTTSERGISPGSMKRRRLVARLPDSNKRQAASALAEKYRQLLDVDTRLERLDKAVAENERRIRQVTRGRRDGGREVRFPKARGSHRDRPRSSRAINEELFKLIDRTERKLRSRRGRCSAVPSR